MLGIIESVLRNFLAAHADVFKGHIVAVGCSGNSNIYNSSTALLTILEVVDEWLEANSQDDDQGESN